LAKCKLVLSLEDPRIIANYFSARCYVTEVAEILMIVEVQAMLTMLCDYCYTTLQKIFFWDSCDI